MVKIKTEAFQEIKTFTEVTVVEERDEVYYISTSTSIDENTYVHNLWCTNILTKKSQMIALDSPSLIRRGDEGLLVYTDEGMIYKVDLEDKSFHEWEKVNQGIIDFEYDDHLIYHYSIKEESYDSYNKSYKHMGLNTLGKLVLHHKKDLDLFEEDVCQFHYNKTLKKALVVTFDLALKPIWNKIYLLDLVSFEKKLVSNGKYRVGDVLLLDNGHVLMTACDMTKKSRNDDKSLIEMDMNGQVLSQSDCGCSFEEMGVYTDSHTFKGKRAKYKSCPAFVSVDENGENILEWPSQRTLKDLYTIDAFDAYKDGYIAVGLKECHLQELYLLGPESKRLTHHNKRLSELALEAKFFKGNIPGWVIEPTDCKRHAPAVFVIHGGPKGMYMPAFSFDLQLLASKGYYVIFTNPPGSDGYGNDYSNIRGVFGSVPYEELMTYLDEILNAYPMIDRKRIGVMGGSYGGYLTNYIITKTHRFKAAISARGISSMINSFMSSDIGFEYVYEYMDAKTPWSHPNDFLEASPLYACDLVQTPTLFIHGEKDSRCHVTESLNMYHALTYFGVETRIKIFKDEGHGFVRSGQPKHRLARYQLITSWFKEHLQEDK